MTALGEMLRERRQEHRWTLQDVARQTRIRQDYLQALEEGNYDALPADVQARGFLRTYALALGLDPIETLHLYEQERGEPELVSIAPVSYPPRRRSCVLPSLGLVLFAGLAVAAIALWYYFGYLKPSSPLPTATMPPATPTRLRPTATSTATQPGTVPSPTTTPHAYTGVEAVLEISSDCWVRVIADGVQVFQGTLASGTTRTFSATRDLRIRMGNAGGVRVILNGQDLGVQGRPGQVVDQIWSAHD